jgi:hypothetical protein
MICETEDAFEFRLIERKLKQLGCQSLFLDLNGQQYVTLWYVGKATQGRVQGSEIRTRPHAPELRSPCAAR